MRIDDLGKALILLGSLIFAMGVYSAPLPKQKEKVTKFSFAGEWEMDWDMAKGTVNMREDGSLEGFWPSRWIGTWVQEGMKITFRERYVTDTGEAGSDMIWHAELETQPDGSFKGKFFLYDNHHPISIKRIARLKN